MEFQNWEKYFIAIKTIFYNDYCWCKNAWLLWEKVEEKCMLSQVGRSDIGCGSLVTVPLNCDKMTAEIPWYLFDPSTAEIPWYLFDPMIQCVPRICSRRKLFLQVYDKAGKLI